MYLLSLKILAKKLLTTLSDSTVFRCHLKLIYSDEILYFKAIKLLPGATVFETLNIQQNANLYFFEKSANLTLQSERGGLNANVSFIQHLIL